ncbi:hypothetical protein HHK36_000939 [Tetracentron sinense]|uniref:Exostosin GT47 domain-containing protein n=1 Tax=Tetracentron sinense TaxID=13715 RepID=A0A835DUG3_TETSI|nr:hypothetical protein HHK36_000939 [Tetracentron sinense]
MESLFQLITARLMKELRRCCTGCRIDWKKLFFVVAIMTTAGAMVRTYTLPYPLTIWFLFPPVTVSSERALNGTLTSSKTIPTARLEQLPLIPIAPTVLLNSTTGLIQSVEPGVEETGKVSPSINSAPRRRQRKNNKTEKSIEPIVMPPPPRSVPSHSQRYIGSLPPDEALMYAKKEIEHAQITTDDPDLYAPLFRNVSVFKRDNLLETHPEIQEKSVPHLVVAPRVTSHIHAILFIYFQWEHYMKAIKCRTYRSYELMENILKVYIYKDGARPIFHQPYLRGIYASEGWFMKLLEGNRQFVTRDPKRAHLFYLPYSARQMEIALYVPDSHNMRPLSILLRDYVNKIAAKYSFWNRTQGSDHFLVACHDWGPYTVNEHKELSRNTIKALCNADLSEGIFVARRDVSLPETTIRNPKRPLRDLGGKRVSQRSILAFFAGNMHGRVRPTLLQYWGNKDEDMRIYGPLPKRISRKMSYVQHMKSSRFCICPMGYEVNSPRIVEAIYYECVPVIIADNFVPPFNEVLDWSAFSVIVAEKDIPSLKEILLAIPMKRYLSMQTNVKMLQKHFLWNPKPIRYDLFHMILHSIWFNRLNQIQIPE